MVVIPSGVHTWLWRCLGCTFLYRKEQACNVPISAVVVHGRLQDGRTHAGGKNGQRGFASHAGEVVLCTLYLVLRTYQVPSSKHKVLTTMRGNIPIPETPYGEDLWLMVLVTQVRERRTQQGRLFYDCFARNATGSINLRLWEEILENQNPISPGLWGITGRLESHQDRPQFNVAEFRPITIEQYREHQNSDPAFPKAYTFDIETLTLTDFRERVGPQLERSLRLGNMRLEQQQRYLEDIAAEEERCYALGSLNATSGRILCIAVHVGPIPGLNFDGFEQTQSERVFGIDADGTELEEKKALVDFLKFMDSFDPEVDELVGHNVLSFDLPFIFQRCLVHCIPAQPFVNLAEYNVRGVFDTMRQWWLGDRRSRVSLDDIAWALGIESSKTADAEGSKVFDLYQAGKLTQIREYNLRDVRVTWKIYERMVECFGRAR